jgi:DNA-directed RNA polymerase subunit omega
MARITVEDCLLRVPDRFELVLLTAERVRQIGNGAAMTLDTKDEPKTVSALREIAAGSVEPETLRAGLIDRLCRNQPDEGPIGDDELDAEGLAALARSIDRPVFLGQEPHGDHVEAAAMG